LSIKDICSQGEEGCPVRTRVGGGFFRCELQRSAIFGAKNFRFFEIYGASTRTRGERVEPVRTRRRVYIFVNLCRLL